MWLSPRGYIRYIQYTPFLLSNDFAHIPWEDTPNFPKPPQRKKFLQNCWWRVRGIFLGYVGEILDLSNLHFFGVSRCVEETPRSPGFTLSSSAGEGHGNSATETPQPWGNLGRDSRDPLTYLFAVYTYIIYRGLIMFILPYHPVI